MGTGKQYDEEFKKQAVKTVNLNRKSLKNVRPAQTKLSKNYGNCTHTE